MTLLHPYAIGLCLALFSISHAQAITLYSQSSGTWAPTTGTVGLFNDAANGSGTAYDGNTITWQGSTVDIVIQAGHTIAFQHVSFTIGNLTVALGGKLFADDDNGFFNYILDVQGSNILIDGKLGNGIPPDPSKADRLGLATQGGNITGVGELTLRELQWNFQSAPLKVTATLNIYMYYNGAWDTFYLYSRLGAGMAQDLTVGVGGHFNVYGNFAADFDIRFPHTGSPNATDFKGKLGVEGTMTVQEGSLILKNDNSAGQDFTLSVVSDGLLLLPQSILGNGGVGDPNPYPGVGIDRLEVMGTLDSKANDPVLYTSARALVNLNNAGSNMKLSGAANQLLDDDVQDARYHNVELAGVGPKQLEGPTAIDNTLTFNAGVLELGNHDLTMTKTFSSGQTNNAFINAGPSQFVETNGQGSLKAFMPAGGFFSPGYLTLPVGKTTYNAVTFQSYGLVGDFMSARVADQVLSNGTFGTAITSLALNKTWFIEEDVPGGSSLNLTLTWTIQDQSTDFNPSNTYISHYTNNAWDTDPQYANGKPVAASGSLFTVTRNGANDFSPFTVFSFPSIPLPVAWLSFEARPAQSKVKLEWSTAWEENNEHFLVEHSINGQQFRCIGKVDGKGTPTLAQSYFFWHQNPAVGLHYYRLKQVDYDGDWEYSPITSVHMKGEIKQKKLHCFPNPVRGQLQVQLPVDPVPDSQLLIINSSGQIIRTVFIRNHLEQLDLSELLPGLYTLLFQTPNKSYSTTFIKE